MTSVLAIILAGGKGKRLFPLTQDRCKPAVPFGGKYRVIDFTLSNCIHSGIRQINVMVQYLSDSLQKHIRDGWSILSPALNEYIEVYPPQRRYSEHWYRGTADAIFQNLFTIERVNPEYILVLSGDHIYKMDYREILRDHIENKADLTIATVPVPIESANQFGVLEVNSKRRIIGFEEKPMQPKPSETHPRYALASMGIYLFSRKTLFEEVIADAHSSSSHDFGKDIIPKMVAVSKVFSFSHQYSDGRARYWRDVGTIQAFYESHMDLLENECSLELFREDWKIRTFQSHSAPNRIDQTSQISNSLIAGDSIIQGKVHHSVLFPGVVLEEGTEVEDSILFENVHIKKGSRIKRAILEKDLVIPEATQIGINLNKEPSEWTRSPGNITVIPKNYQFI